MENPNDAVSHTRKSAPRRRRIWLYVAALCVLVLGLVIGVPLLLRDALDFTAEAELQSSVRSPDGSWEVRTYYVDPGAMASAWGRVDLVSLRDGKTRELWTGPPLPSAPVWLSDTTVLVGEQKLDVHGKATDWDSASVGGFSTPKQAVEEYIRGLAAADLSAVQRASRLMVTQPTLPQLQHETLLTTEKLVVLTLNATQKHDLTASDQAEFDVRATLRWPDGKTRVLRLTALSIKERGTWHAEWAVPSSIVTAP